MLRFKISYLCFCRNVLFTTFTVDWFVALVQMVHNHVKVHNLYVKKENIFLEKDLQTTANTCTSSTKREENATLENANV